MLDRQELAGVPIEALRHERSLARRRAELARMRPREASTDGADEVAQLADEVRALTDELIARYSADLALVDALLAPAPRDAGGRRGRGQR